MITKNKFEQMIKNRYGWGKSGEYLSRETSRRMVLSDGSLSPYHIYELINRETRDSVEVARYYLNRQIGFCIAY